MYDKQPGEQLDYNQLLLKHLDRMSSLTSTIQGAQVLHFGNMAGSETRFTEQDKREAYKWTVKFLDKIIPDQIKDKEYNEKKNKLIDDSKRKVKDEDGEEITIIDYSFYNGYLNLGINLLARKGLLIQNKGIGKYVNKSKNKEAEEEWEE